MGRSKIMSCFVLLVLLGCGGSGVELATVEGTITVEGRPLSGGFVRFMPINGGRTASGRTDKDGHYTMQYSVHDDGVLVGPARVAITTGSLEDPKHSNETIAFEFNHESKLEVNVENKRNVFDFDVKLRPDMPAQKAKARNKFAEPD